MTDAEALRAAAKLVPVYQYVCHAIAKLNLPSDQYIKLIRWIHSMLDKDNTLLTWQKIGAEIWSNKDPRAIAYRQAWCEHLAQICEREDRK